MLKIILKAVIIIFLGMNFASAESSLVEKAAVQKVLDQVFAAMRAGDAETLKTLILPDTPLDRANPDKPVTRGISKDWIDWVSTLKPGQADEQIFDVKIHVEGPLAVAWAPFTIALDGELKSCGVNQFTLVKQPDGWRVAYLIDTHTPEKCLSR
ncbi:MAG: nuclear transport factor 2 family protein [Alphaproteobacteria bacterium]|nr:nuclear transport factor 2 family protein [Alphaproteobacteria bacterium]HPF45893.1 nuclear transport factor 2 family protein [Emcibacteraceae bacterium]